jgi:hypothetical protein
MDALRAQRDTMLSNYKPQIEPELERISAAMKDHQNFWHPHCCKES